MRNQGIDSSELMSQIEQPKSAIDYSASDRFIFDRASGAPTIPEGINPQGTIIG